MGACSFPACAGPLPLLPVRHGRVHELTQALLDEQGDDPLGALRRFRELEQHSTWAEVNAAHSAFRWLYRKNENVVLPGYGWIFRRESRRAPAARVREHWRRRLEYVPAVSRRARQFAADVRRRH